MITKLDVPVSVECFYDCQRRQFVPKRLWWTNRNFSLTKIGLHHVYHKGRTLYHVFSMASQFLFFRLELNSETLNWSLKEVGDGLPN